MNFDLFGKFIDFEIGDSILLVWYEYNVEVYFDMDDDVEYGIGFVFIGVYRIFVVKIERWKIGSEMKDKKRKCFYVDVFGDEVMMDVFLVLYFGFIGGFKSMMCFGFFLFLDYFGGDGFEILVSLFKKMKYLKCIECISFFGMIIGLKFKLFKKCKILLLLKKYFSKYVCEDKMIEYCLYFKDGKVDYGDG